MTEGSDRVELFKSEIASMRIKDPSRSLDARLVWVGIVLMVLGVGATIVAYFLSHQSRDPLFQNDVQLIGMAGIAIAVVGSALYLRCSLAEFQRFWLARLIYEQRVQTDRLLSGEAPEHAAD